MGLIYHLPLLSKDEIAYNKGSTPTTIPYGNVTATTDGILGDGYLFNGSSSYITIQNSKIFSSNMTFACWIYMTTVKNCFILDMRSSGTGLQPLYYNTSSGIQVYSSASPTGGYITTGTLEANTWYHICLSIKNGKCTLYLNGNAVGSTVTVGIPTNAAPITIGSRYSHDSATTFNGIIQDVRFYNHALSKKEAYELSKALMLHFKFDSECIGTTTNIDSCKNSMTSQSLTGFASSSTTSTFGFYYGYRCFKITLSNSSITAWTGSYLNFNPLSYGAVVGDTVTRSCWMYVPSGQTKPGQFTESIEGNSTNKTYNQYDFNKCDTWQRVWMKGTIADTGTNNYLHYFMAMSSGSVDFTFYIRDFQAEINDHPTGYTDSESLWAVCNDGVWPTLGYPNEYSNTTSSEITRIGKYSGSFDGTFSFIEFGNFKTNLPNQPYTMSFWVFPTETGRGVVFGNHAGSSETFNIEIYSSNQLRIYYNNDPNIIISDVTMTANSWTHITIAYGGTGSSLVVFKNGIQAYSSTVSKVLNCTNGSYRIGSDYRSANSTSETTRFKGYICDFRLYGKRLPDNDIIKLCRYPAMQIDRNGGNHAYRFEEDASLSTAQVTPTGIRKISYVSEIVTLDDGSTWIQIMHHNNKGAKNLFTSANLTAMATKAVYKNQDAWCNFQLINDIGLYNSKYEFFLIEEKTAGNFVRYRWSQTINPHKAAYSDTTSSSSNITKIENLPSAYGGMYKNGSNAYFVMNNGVNGNWFGAMGSVATHGVGIPGIADSTAGIMDLWMRIDPDDANIYKETRGGVVLGKHISEDYI